MDSTLEGTLRSLIQDIVREEVSRAMRGPAPQGEYLSTADAARLAAVTQGTVRRWIRARRLAGFGAGRELRVSRAELEQLMKCGRDDSPRGDGPDTPEARARAALDALVPRRRGAGATVHRP